MRMRSVVRFILVLACLPLVLLLAENTFLNVWLPLVINLQPERVRVTWDMAWSVYPGRVEVTGLRIRSQSPFDQVYIVVDHATGTVDLRSLLDQQFRAHDLQAQGASFRYRARLDAPRPPGTGPAPAETVPPPPVEEGAVAPGESRKPDIEGLSNPPVPNPDTIYPPPPGYWTITLADVAVRGVSELWIEDYRFVGDAELDAAEFKLQPTQFVSLIDAQVRLVQGQVLVGADPALLDVTGDIAVALDGLRPADNPGRSMFGFLTVRAGVKASVKNLEFLDFYLRSAPWLKLSGGLGSLDLDVRMDHGVMQPGSELNANVEDILARFFTYSIVGDGRVKVAVTENEGLASSTLDVGFADFSITRDGDTAPHVKGAGLSVHAQTADVALDGAFTALDVAIDLPESTIPDAAVYDHYLPSGMGLDLKGGTGTISGHLEVTTPENVVRGQLQLAARSVRATLDDLSIAGNVLVHAVVAGGNLDTGRFDISGSRFELRGVRVSDRTEERKGADNSAGWWATLAVPRGSVASGSAVFLDAKLALKVRDSVPFVTIFSEKQPLPGWVRGMLRIDGLSGGTRVRIGDKVLQLHDLELSGSRQFNLLLNLSRQENAYRGKLFVRYGILQAGLRMDGEERRLIVAEPRKWYDAESIGG